MKTFKDLIFFISIFILNIAIFLFLWIKAKFIEVDLNLLILNLRIIGTSLIENIFTGETNIAPRLKYWIIYVPFVLSLAIFFIEKFSKNKKFLQKLSLTIELCIKLMSKKNIFIILIFFLFINFLRAISLDNFLSSKNTLDKTDYFKIIYQEPKIKKKQIKQNTILLAVESFDKQFLIENKILSNKELNALYDLKLENFNISRIPKIAVHPGAEYSIGAQIAMMCGIPLKLTNVKYDYIKSTLGKFHSKELLKNYYCIQDYLKKENYLTEYISNTKINFMGTENFLKSHPFDKIYDNQKLLKLGYEPNLNGFDNSISDKDLINFLLRRIKKNLKNNSNFFIAANTVETHPPGSYYDREKCNFEETQKTARKNIVLIKESDLNLKDKKKMLFVHSAHIAKDKLLIRKSFLCLINSLQNFLLKIDSIQNINFNLLIVSDHGYKYNSDKNGSIFNIILTPKNKKLPLFKKDNIYSNYDLYAILLNMTAFNLQNNRAGVGSINGFEKDKYEINFTNTLKFLNSTFPGKYETLW